MIDEEFMLRDLRKAHEMTQEKLAAVLGVKQECRMSRSDPTCCSRRRASRLRRSAECLRSEPCSPADARSRSRLFRT